MFVASLLSLVISTAPVPGPVSAALESATVAGARLATVSYTPSRLEGCTVARAEVAKPIDSTGRYAVRVSGTRADGRACDGWAWAEVRVLATVSITNRAVRAGDALDGLLTQEERELKRGLKPALQVPPRARAAIALPAGRVVEEHHLRAEGPMPGEAVTVEVRSAGMTVTQRGRAVACRAGFACARLDSGRRAVEGIFEDGRILVELP